MIDETRCTSQKQERDRVRRRTNVTIDKDNYQYFPEKKQIDYYDNDVHQRVAVYARVSTDNVKQTTSYELQKKYYKDFVLKHPNWTLVKIYADEGISGTSRKHRDAFNEMIQDAYDGNIDMIVCKNVSRFARNVEDCIHIVRKLASLRSPVGVFFESECVFSLKDDSQMALTFLATMAEEESHTRSRSMETSLRMRLDNGIPLTPKLLGYSHDADGELVINEAEAPTVKLAFYMYLYGYSTQQIADVFVALGHRTYLGNLKWTSNSIIQILRNERHCGDVLTRKTFTPNYRDHLSRKNRGERPQSLYYNHHPAIVSRDDFIAVQKILDNAKYGNRGFLPQLKVIERGIFKGYVGINPRWASFKASDYLKASLSVYTEEERGTAPFPLEVEVDAGDFDLRGFEITRSEFLDSANRPAASFGDNRMSFSIACTRKFREKGYVELLINPVEQKIAVRPTNKDNRSGVQFSINNHGTYTPRGIPATAFLKTIYELFDWDVGCKYRIIGSLYEQDDELAYIFDVENTEIYLSSGAVSPCDASGSHLKPLMSSGKRIRAIPQEWMNSFGMDYYLHELSISALEAQSEEDWKLRLEGRCFEIGTPLNVTPFEELRSFIKQQLKDISIQEAGHAGTAE